MFPLTLTKVLCGLNLGLESVCKPEFLVSKFCPFLPAILPKHNLAKPA